MLSPLVGALRFSATTFRFAVTNVVGCYKRQSYDCHTKKRAHEPVYLLASVRMSMPLLYLCVWCQRLYILYPLRAQQEIAALTPLVDLLAS